MLPSYHPLASLGQRAPRGGFPTLNPDLDNPPIGWTTYLTLALRSDTLTPHASHPAPPVPLPLPLPIIRRGFQP